MASQPTPKRLGRYEILERIATGGMAEIFLACERGTRGLERLVVVKRILPHLAIQETFVDMFVQEARIVARLNHPNVVQILDLAEDGDEVFIVMEYVPGSTLRELTDASDKGESPIPVDAAVGIVMQACKGAHAAHELKDVSNQPLGLVHRDISPHNLMVTPEGNVKLLDFGIAKATEGLENTATGTLKGKYCYMSPEQANHQPLDRRSDVFALGIVLWELLAAQRLYKRGNELASMAAIAHEDAPPIRSVRPGVPQAIEDVLVRALCRDREARLSTADEFRRLLQDAAQHCGLNPTEDCVAACVGTLLGHAHDARRTEVDAAVERTLAQTPSISFRQRQPLSEEAVTAVERRAPNTVVTETATRLQPAAVASVVSPPAWRRAFVAGLAALGGAGLAFMGLVYLVGPDRPVDPPLTGPPLIVAFPPVMDPALQQTELEPLRIYLQRTIRRPVTFPVTRSYDETADGVLAGRYQFGSFPPYLYLKSHKKNPDLQALAFKLFEGSYGTDGVLLVHESSTASSVKDLAGRTFCFTDKASLTGYMLPRAALKAAGLDPEVAAAWHHFSGDHTQVLRDLLDGRCEVGATFSGAYLTAGNAGVQVSRLRVLTVTGRSPQDAICGGPGATKAEREAVQKALLAFDPRRHADAGFLGAVQRISGFSVGSDEAYQPLRQSLSNAGMLD